MIKFTFGRAARVDGVSVDHAMGVNTWAAFAGSDENAVVDGDLAVTENELQPALKSCAKPVSISWRSIPTSPAKNPGLSFSIIRAAARLKASPKACEKLCRLERLYRQNLNRMSDNRVGFCYN
jgi:Domain of Unknown Function (DUF1259)